MKVLLGVSNRHIHLNKEDYQTLFHEMSFDKKKDLVQKGQYASNLTVDIKTEKAMLKNVRVLGPLRDYTQVELSKSDAYHLGINPPLRNSGDLTNAALVEIVGPYQTIKKECAILANRHIHISKEERKKLGLEHIEEVKGYYDSEKGARLEHIYIKEQEDAVLEMHLDMDDANAILAKTGDYLEIEF